MKITIEQYEHDPRKYLDAVKPGIQIEISDLVILIHPQDLRYLEKCAELVDSLPISIEDDEL